MRIFSVLVRDLEEDRKGLTTYSITVVAIITALALIQAIAFRFTGQPDESIYDGTLFRLSLPGRYDLHVSLIQ